MYLTKDREILDFVRAVREVQAAMPHIGVGQAVAEAAATLGVQIPSDIEYRAMLMTAARMEAARKRSRGRQRSEAQTKSEAAAALVVYFESLGYRPEHALRGALRCLGLDRDGYLSRKCAREAVTKYKAMTAPDQYEALARFTYAKYKPGAILKFPQGV
jgi:enoyl-CoA hydratase/carnithine racemase